MGFFYNGGGERTVLSQAIELQRRGHKVHVYAPTIQPNCFPELIKQVKTTELAGFLPQGTPIRNASGMILSSLRVPIKRFKDFDVVLAHGQPSNWIASRIKHRLQTPYVSYLHQVNRFFQPREVDKQTGWKTDGNLQFLEFLHRGNLVVKELDMRSIRQADYVLTNSHWIKEKIQDYYGVEPTVCHPGVDTKTFTQTQHQEEQGRYILSTNRHYPQKRLDYLVDIMRILTRSHPGIKCIITGQYTPYTNTLQKLVTKAGLSQSIHLTGNLTSEKLLDTYTGSYIYTFTSPEEDFGLGPLEAAACGVPSVVWDHAGPRETVVDGVTGYRVTPYSVTEMAERHLELLANPPLRDTMGKAARSHVMDHFTWEIHVDKLEKTLLTAC
ncbi:MAG: glycosyltransferase family 4 protein [Candidatus Bathyarchaeota archaeon]|nr:glycosyltransferase family 4 protein [Candidatus Bathyarchaeota archaeon]